MAKQVALEAQVRDGLGKEKSKKYRVKGLIPAEFYGKAAENLHLLVNHKDFEKAVKSSDAKYNSIFSLTIKNKDKESKEIVFLREYQRDPITDRFLHLDFYKVDTKQQISTKVKVRLIGISPAIKAGLAISQNMHELPIKCLPLDIPNQIEVDISKLEKAHDAVRVGDMNIPGITIELPAGQQIVHAEVPREIKIEEVTGPVSAEVPTTVQGAPEEGEAKPEAGKGEAKKPEAGKEPAKKEEPKKPEAKKQ